MVPSMEKRKWTTMTAIMVGIVLLTGCGEQEGKKMEEIAVKNQVMGVSVHDPSIVKADGKYYIFGSHMEAAVSEDLQSFKTFASGVNAKNPLFDNLFDDDLYSEIDLKHCAEKRISAGGTSVASIEMQIDYIENFLK